MRKILALFFIAALLIPALPHGSFTPVYVYGDLNGYAFRNYITAKTSNYTSVNNLDDVPADARALIVAPMDRNKTLYDKALSLAKSGLLVIILYDRNYSYDNRLDRFDISIAGYVNSTVEISKLPLSARSAGVDKVYAQGTLFNATFAKKNVLIPGRYNGSQCNETAFAVYKKNDKGRIVLIDEEILNNTSNAKLFEAIYRTLYRIPYPVVKGYSVKSLATSPGSPFTVYVVNASTFDLEPYYKTDNDISVKVYVYRYSNGSQVTTLILNYDSYKKAYFFPATDFGGKRGVFLYNITVSRVNGTVFYSHTGILRIAADKGIVIGYLNVSESLVETLRKYNYVAYQVNSTSDITAYLADALLVGESINDTLLNMTRQRYSEGGSFIGIAGNRTEAFNVTLGEVMNYTHIAPTKRFANVTINLNSSPYLIVSTPYHVPLIVGDDKEIASMIENDNGGKAIIVASEKLVDPEYNLDVLLALIDNASVRHRLNVTYKSIYENDSRLFYFYVTDNEGNPVNVTFVFVSGASYEYIGNGTYKVTPEAENFTIVFYQPGYGYKAVAISLGGYPENPGTSPGEHEREASAKNIGLRTFIAFLLLVALLAGAFYVFKK